MKKSNSSMITMMVAVLVCFLWVTGCAKKAVQQGDVTGAQPAATAPAPVVAKAPAEAAVKATPGMERQVREEAAPAKADVELADIHFDFDKSVLRAKDREILKGHAEWLMKNKDYKVLIEGHCDERGTTEYNLALGERRATEAMKYLVGLGIEKGRIKTISYGEERPLDPGHNEEAWAKNRRAHFVIKMK